ncbi:MAG: LuxR C-terminal-related transcriptional regulator [Acidimicrobiia bacterium]
MTDGPVRDQAALQALLSVISDGVMVTDLDGVRLYSNPALDHLVGSDACAPRRSSDPPTFVPPNKRDEYLGILDKMQQGRLRHGSLSFDFDIVDGEGEAIRVPVDLVPATRGGDTIAAVLWVFHAHDNDGLGRARQLEKAIKSIAAEVETLGYLSNEPQARHLPGLDDLSQRESEVLALLLAGHRVTTMATELCVSKHTVRNHLKAIFKKLKVHSQAELIQLAKGTGNTARTNRGQS